jgi:hypothetical protein
MTPDDVHALTVMTGRLSAAVFVLALLGAALRWRPVPLWLTFLGVHTVHFAVVLLFAVANQGRNLFPGGTSLDEAGGWGVLLGSGTLFYALALTSLACLRAGQRAKRWLRIAGPLAATLIALMFAATYLPLVPVSPFFMLPVAAIGAALGLYLMRSIPAMRTKP